MVSLNVIVIVNLLYYFGFVSRTIKKRLLVAMKHMTLVRLGFSYASEYNILTNMFGYIMCLFVSLNNG